MQNHSNAIFQFELAGRPILAVGFSITKIHSWADYALACVALNSIANRQDSKGRHIWQHFSKQEELAFLLAERESLPEVLRRYYLLTEVVVESEESRRFGPYYWGMRYEPSKGWDLATCHYNAQLDHRVLILCKPVVEK